MPRAGLTRDAVVDLAVRIVDERADGFDSLTLASVASAAGVAVPSLYKHVASLADLRAAVGLVAVRELGRRVAGAAVGISGERALRALGHELRAFAREHPGLFAASQAAPAVMPDDAAGLELRRASADVVGTVAAVLRGFELPAEREVDAIRAVRSALYGFAGLEAAGGFRMPDDVDASFESLLDMLVAGIGALAGRPAS